MNDRFKFRVWNKEQQKLYSWDDLKKSKGDNSFYWCMLQAQNDEKNNILMQCTGLKDKTGKLIYEGDIVNQIYEDETIYKCEVVYNNCSFQLKHIEDKNKNYINTPLYCYAINYLGHYTEKRLEVIGNIYKNKELLECQK